jgi:hypothetical protein
MFSAGVRHVALRRHERMRIAARRWGKLAVCLDSFNAAFRENQANCQFAPLFSEKKNGEDTDEAERGVGNKPGRGGIAPERVGEIERGIAPERVEEIE